jgi:hypothetical protein
MRRRSPTAPRNSQLRRPVRDRRNSSLWNRVRTELRRRCCYSSTGVDGFLWRGAAGVELEGFIRLHSHGDSDAEWVAWEFAGGSGA